MLLWFDQDPARYCWIAGFALLGAFALALAAIVQRPARRTGFDWPWALAILLVLLAGRWPGWTYPHELSQDESQLIAGAITLRHDPMFWRSVDGDTAGPADFFALLPMGSLLGGDSYLSARLTAWLLIAIALAGVHQALVPIAGRAVARACGFGALAFEALSWDRSFLHYSTELVPVALMSAGLLLAVRRLWSQAHWRWNFVGGLVIGTMPFAKLQAAPIGLLLGGCWIAGEIAWRLDSNLRRNLGVLIAGALVPALVCAGALTWTQQWPNAVIPYFLHNAGYVSTGAVNGDLLIDTWLLSIADHGLLYEWLLGTGVILLLLLPLVFRTSDRRTGAVALAAAGLVATSVVCILIPGRSFLHYWQFILVPWTFLLGVCTGRSLDASVRFRFAGPAILAVMLLASGGAIIHGWVGLPPRFLGPKARAMADGEEAVVSALRKLSSPGDTLAVWGWMNRYYVESGLRQATRNAHAEAIITDRGFNAFFRARYLGDIRQHAPAVFIDVVGPNGFIFNRPEWRHEIIFPELGAFIRARYEFVAELDGNRIYVRRDRLAALVKDWQAGAAQPH